MLGTQEFRNADSRNDQEAIAHEAWEMSAARAVKEVEGLSPEDLFPLEENKD